MLKPYQFHVAQSHSLQSIDLGRVTATIVSSWNEVKSGPELYNNVLGRCNLLLIAYPSSNHRNPQIAKRETFMPTHPGILKLKKMSSNFWTLDLDIDNVLQKEV